jgi:hypothetical protein
MQVKSGSRLKSVTCSTEVIVIRAPIDDVDLRCGGHPMALQSETPNRQPMTGEGTATLLGKRYTNEAIGLEVLCTKPGDGWLSIGAEPLGLKDAKQLPSSD